VIVSFIAYGVVTAAFVAASAWLLERALGRLRRPRRVIWLVALLVALALPPIVVWSQEPVLVRPPAPAAGTPVTVVQAAQVAESLRASPALRDARIADLPVDTVVAGLWLLASLSLVTFHVVGAWRLSRRARRWGAASLDSQPISVAPDIGPALYGWWRPRVVFPGWLLAAPETTQRLALAHEREHLAVRDPQLLAAATLAVVLLPWNAPLLWMLRRLRFAMEVDCDARVIRAGADASDYGLALLFVSERQSRSPMGTLALIERASQLERRIDIMINAPRHRALVAGLCLALASACAFAAAQVAPPARIHETPLKPVPGGESARQLGYAFERHIQQRYAGLLDEDVGGTAIVIALVNADRTVAKSAKIVSPRKIDEIQADESMFEAIGMKASEVPYLGAMGMQSPRNADRKLLVIYTEKLTPGERFMSKLAPDTRAIDREIFDSRFPDSAKSGMPAGSHPWVLLDRQGNVLRSGVEPVNPKALNATLEGRFAGIKTREITLTPLVDAKNEPLKDGAGRPLHLFSVWLAPESPPPDA
jgi:beta-lactamase regulating signal transducer with metallopeptidase domain